MSVRPDTDRLCATATNVTIGQELMFTSSSELNDFLNGDVAKHGRQEQGPRRYYAARRWMLPAASRITSYTRRGWESIGT
jgi:hypothetical protein